MNLLNAVMSANAEPVTLSSALGDITTVITSLAGLITSVGVIGIMFYIGVFKRVKNSFKFTKRM